MKQEAQLTSTLALLSALREDVNRVTAVAVRELPHPETLEILIAVNKATQTAGDSYLQEIKATFESYFKILSEATNGKLSCTCLSGSVSQGVYVSVRLALGSSTTSADPDLLSRPHTFSTKIQEA
jgi:hypothetical protein